MTSRPIKMAVVLLLGFVLTWQGVFASSARQGATAQGARQSCCCTGCDHKHCATPACCVKRDAPSAPVAPASLPSASQNEFHALVASVVSMLTLPSRPTGDLPACAPLSAPVTSIPLFQRNCSYLL
ncbi:MAG: hypothetical protein O2960_01350 [Verrucomicrobia bacterium]|nr:hypothetical protein [Verrucomicrobiota bacterium]